MSQAAIAHRGAAAPEMPRLRRKLWWIAAASAVVLGVTVSLLVAFKLDHRYGPIQQGNFGGQYSSRNFVASSNGFSYSLAPTPGVTGELIASLDNLGSHSVKVNSIETDSVVTRIQWSTYRVASNVEGANTPWQSFPATVPAHGRIRLLITIHHPGYCQNEPANSSARYYSGIHTVHWESLLHHHTTQIDDGIGDRSVGIC